MRSLLSAALLTACIPFTAIQAQTSVVPRLVAYAHTYYDGGDYLPKDSSTLQYSSGRIYNKKWDMFLYDTNRVYTYQVPYSNYKHRIKEYQLYDTNNNVTIDRTMRKRLTDGVWRDSIQYLYLYDSHKNLLSKTQQRFDDVKDFWNNVDRYVYTYDPVNDNMLTKLYQVYSVNGWVSIYDHDYDYDSYNNVYHDLYKTYDSVGMHWNNKLYTQHTYNTHNNLTQSLEKRWITASSSWYDTARFQYSYDASGIYVQSKMRQVWYAPNWVYDSNIVYTYDTHNDMISEQHQYYWGYPTLWMDSTLYNYTYDADHNRISSVKQNWLRFSGIYQNEYKQEYTYNSYHQMTSIRTDSWYTAGGFWQPSVTDYYHRYYYQIAASVAETPRVNGVINIFPVPANDLLNIDLKWDGEQSGTIAIYDITGKLWNQWKISKGSSYHNVFPVATLPAGDYVITVTSENNKLSRVFTIAH